MIIDSDLELACAAWWESTGNANCTWADAKEEWKPEYRARMRAALEAFEKAHMTAIEMMMRTVGR